MSPPCEFYHERGLHSLSDSPGLDQNGLSGRGECRKKMDDATPGLGYDIFAVEDFFEDRSAKYVCL
jgi:hypothetical protein